ncbi:MAG TPA: hypothetical protein V6D14_23425 [Coleofasciculaceae cyanobacterium]
MRDVRTEYDEAIPRMLDGVSFSLYALRLLEASSIFCHGESGWYITDLS